MHPTPYGASRPDDDSDLAVMIVFAWYTICSKVSWYASKHVCSVARHVEIHVYVTRKYMSRVEDIHACSGC